MGKIFACFGGSEKLAPGDHRRVPSALIFKAEEVELPAFDHDDRFFVPAYYGPSGWRALDLAEPEVDSTEVAELVERRTASSRRGARSPTWTRAAGNLSV